MDEDLKQEIGFRIWNENRSAILLYLLGKSTTWTIPTVQNESIMDSLAFHLPKSDIVAAICIVNAKDSVPIISPRTTRLENVIYQYIIYDITIDIKGLVMGGLPDNMRASHFMPFESANGVAYKTPILNHLMKYMEKEEEQCN